MSPVDKVVYGKNSSTRVQYTCLSQKKITNRYIAVFGQPRIQDSSVFRQILFQPIRIETKKKLINNYYLFWIIYVFSRF